MEEEGEAKAILVAGFRRRFGQDSLRKTPRRLDELRVVQQDQYHHQHDQAGQRLHTSGSMVVEPIAYAHDHPRRMMNGGG